MTKSIKEAFDVGYIALVPSGGIQTPQGYKLYVLNGSLMNVEAYELPGGKTRILRRTASQRQ